MNNQTGMKRIMNAAIKKLRAESWFKARVQDGISDKDLLQLLRELPTGGRGGQGYHTSWKGGQTPYVKVQKFYEDGAYELRGVKLAKQFRLVGKIKEPSGLPTPKETNGNLCNGKLKTTWIF